MAHDIKVVNIDVICNEFIIILLITLIIYNNTYYLLRNEIYIEIN